MRSTYEMHARRLASTVRRAASTPVYGLPYELPGAIYLHSDKMQEVRAADVLRYLNPPILSRIGIRFWQADEDTHAYHDDVQASLEEQSDARPGATFSHTLLFCRISRLFGKDPHRISSKKKVSA